jgi:glycine hydroxymethyltransferase
MLVDLRPFDGELTGKDAQIVLDAAGITLNRNARPDDPRSPFVTSGIRIGTPAVTTQGMTEPHMAEIGRLIADALRQRGDAEAVAGIREEVRDLCRPFAPYPT